MATIVRVKRRRNDDPLESLVVHCKRKKEEHGSSTNVEKNEIQSSLKFAGTVTTKVEGVSSYIRDAIRKEKLKKEYKQHTVNVTAKNRQRQKKDSQKSRLKIISSLRKIDLEELDKSDVNTDSIDAKSSESSSKHQISETESESRTNGALSNGALSNNSKNVGVNGKVYQLLDVELDQPSNIPTFESILKESQATDKITCNSVPLIKEKVESTEEEFVYDLYYTNNQDFNFKALESDLTIQAYDDELIFADDRNFTNDEIYEDEDDSNDEDNWRNDYPDEDPHFYENEDAEYYYGDDVDEVEAFEHQDHNLADWMSSRCHIEDDEAASDDEKGSSYDRYYHMIKQEVDQLDDDVIPGD